MINKMLIQIIVDFFQVLQILSLQVQLIKMIMYNNYKIILKKIIDNQNLKNSAI